MNKSNFDRLLKRYLTGQVSEQEKVKIEAWLDMMKTENVSDLELSKEDEEKLFQKIVSNNNNLEEIRTIVPHRNKVTIFGWTLRIAATLLVVVLVSYIGWQVGKQNSGSMEIASSEPVKKVMLTDGSLVWLKGNSKLVYFKKEDENIRYAELKGEALFEVAKDPGTPFVINCGSATLKVVGTSFSVKTNGDSLELLVLTGKVNLSLHTGKKGIDVLPNEKVMYSINSEIEKFSPDANEASVATASTEYNMQFSNISLGQVVKQLQRKFDVVINIENKKAATCSITADLTDQSLENSLVMITEVLDVEYHRSGNSITVSGQGCK